VERLDRWYRDLPATTSVQAFVDAALEKLAVSYHCNPDELAGVPAQGPLIVVANHPYGGLDGLAAIAALQARRADLKVVATRMLGSIEALRPLIIPVDNFSGGGAVAGNARAVRVALRHVQAGGAVLLFPAGEVAHIDWRARCVTDPPWQAGALRFIERSKAAVVPLYVHGSNGVGFQLAGLLHPALRTAMLPREVTNKRGCRLDLRWGASLSAERVAALASRGDLGRQLRARVYALAAPRPKEIRVELPGAVQRETSACRVVPVITADDPAALTKEYMSLASHRLVTVGTLDVLGVTAREAPRLCREVSRLRELSFRAVGEGTGAERDWDRYDEYYEHLIAWDTRKGAIAGGYRLARVDTVRKQYGRGALYLESLFDFREPFFGLLGPAIELGRSFVAHEYQRSFAPLLALWRGIGEYVCRYPRHTRLLGPVSISADYNAAAREILMRYLRWHHFDPVLASLVRSRSPLHPSRQAAMLGAELEKIKEIESVGELLQDVSAKPAGVPVLLRQYLRLGGRVLGFNVDASFGHCLDCLTLVDLRKTPVSVLQKYMDPSRIG
jgi:putative hemolysin